LVVPWPKGAKPVNDVGFIRQVDIPKELDQFGNVLANLPIKYRYVFGYEYEGKIHVLVCDVDLGKIMLLDYVP
jgi:hypothetical protein